MRALTRKSKRLGCQLIRSETNVAARSRVESEGRSLKPCLRTYTWDSLFLQECLARLTPGPDEELLIVTGITTATNHIVPCVAFRPDYEFANRSSVRAQGESSHEWLRTLTSSNHEVVAMLHSHPGSGEGAVQPSSIDVAAQERFERCGYQVITGIFSRDGYVRFFANSVRFRLRLFGAGARFAGKNTVHLGGV